MIISERQVAYENWRLFELFELFEFCLSLVAVSHSQIMTVDGGEDSELAMQRRFDSVHQILKLLFDVHCSQTHQTINSTFGSCSFFSRSAIFNINRRLSFSLAKIGEITNGEILRALDVRVFAQWAAEWSLAWAVSGEIPRWVCRWISRWPVPRRWAHYFHHFQTSVSPVHLNRC